MRQVRVVHAEGDPLSRGRQIGRALGDLIERSLAFYHAYFERRGVASSDLQETLAPYLGAAEETLPGFLDLVKGMAEGAMVPVWELFAVNAFEEIEAALESPEGTLRLLGRGSERCSTFTVSGPGYTLLGHNENWLAGDAGNVAVVIEHPDDGFPAVASPTVVCCIPAVGVNAHWGAQGIQSLVASDDRRGVPRVLVSRHSLEAIDRADALLRAALPGRAGGYGHVFAFAGGDAFTVETTASRESLLEGAGAHTNHYLDPGLAELASPPPDGSVSRYERLLDIVDDRQPTTPEAVMEIMADHESAPQSVCLHPDPADGDEAEAVLFSLVCDMEAGRMWVAAGNPCETPFEEIPLAGVLEHRES
jgi:isopenicillin-N N-acyltransferase like protein